MTPTYQTLRPEHREEMAAWLEDGIQPATPALRWAITESGARERKLAGERASSNPVVEELTDWLYHNASVMAWGYPGALEGWPRVKAAATQRRKEGTAE